MQHSIAPTPSTVSLSRHALQTIRETSQAAQDDRETGGIILGHQYADGRLTVTIAGDPGPAAVRTRDSFRRDPSHAQALADAAWSNDRSVWLGEWHTHPRGPVHPSPIDLATYLSLLRDPALTFRAFLALIVIPVAPEPTIFPWVITEGEGVCVTMAIDGL
ncbi:Mov34/MPN/PAD-1 family protein [Geodermatophilus sp. DSM 44513]|uniref:Mov34/MPN/PAD-1 family protein n=1 Tax=Geodermatophilus sp. DSM 44513 TaxID=1528104 RepID=UPI00128A8756|nr:Mov34/MPN/PAD-1 family protein [Geodermatophilus sp. DSM 44513]WNV74443.1 Mov34/MPN/PAD-1 family protein [Geodermatophilus sp. DSM 44513]